MNSAGRILSLVKKFRNNDLKFKEFFEEEFTIDLDEQSAYVQVILRLNIEIDRLCLDLKNINKFNKYQQDINKLYSIFSCRPPQSNVVSSIGQQDLNNLITRLEVLEDLLEANNITDNITDDVTDNIANILTLIDNILIDLNDKKEYQDLIKMLREVKVLIQLNKINGVFSLEEALEKLLCRKWSTFIPNEYKDDLDKLLGHVYGLWKISKKYAKKPIEYMKKQYDNEQKTIEDNSDIIDIDVENKE